MAITTMATAVASEKMLAVVDAHQLGNLRIV